MYCQQRREEQSGPAASQGLSWSGIVMQWKNGTLAVATHTHTLRLLLPRSTSTPSASIVAHQKILLLLTQSGESRPHARSGRISILAS